MIKTIEVDDSALARLQAVRLADESWSEVIKRVVRPKPPVQHILDVLNQSAPSLETLEAMDETISRRRRQPRSRRA